MKVLVCSKCGKKQNQGKFCLDCGSSLKEIVTNDVGFRPIKTKRSAEMLKRDIRKWLERIGVQQSDIRINTDVYGNEARVEYVLSKNLYTFSSILQRNVTDNLAAVEMFLHSRVLGIERGIETAEQAFAGYEALPDYTKDDADPYQALGFKEKVPFEEAMRKYKELAKRFHPDVNDSPEANRQFRIINKAIKQIEKEK